MRVAAERRADGVYVAAGVELIEPEYRHESARAPGGVWVTPSKVARLGDKLGAETAKRLASDRRSQFQLYQDAGPQSVRLLLRLRLRPLHAPLPGLQARGRPSNASGPSGDRLCPTVPRVQRADDGERSTKAFCSENCRVAAHQESERA